MVLRYSDDKNMYLGWIRGINGVFTAQILRKVNGVWTVLRSVRVGSGVASLRFEAVGSVLSPYVNGVLKTSAFDSILPVGTVGLFTSAKRSIDDFTATAL